MPQFDNSTLDNQAATIESGLLSKSTDLSVIDLLLAIIKHIKMILITTIVAGILTATVTFFMPNIYTATALIIPNEDDKNGISNMLAQLGGIANIIGGASLNSTNKADQYVSMLKSETVRDPIIDKFKLMDVYKEKFRSDVYKELNAKVIITPGKKDGIISIAVSDKDPSLAADMANGLVDSLGKLVTGLSMIDAGKNRLFLEERLASAKSDIATAGDKLKIFLTKNKMVNVTEQAKVSIEGVSQLREQLAVQEVQLAALLRQFTDSSQEVKRTRVSIGNLKAQITRLEGISGNSSIPSLGSVPQLSQDYLRLVGEYKIQEALVDLLTKQLNVAEFSEAKDIFPFQILQKAKVPEKKSKPARATLVLMVTFMVFFCSMFIAIVRENLARMPEENLKRWMTLRAALQFIRYNN